MPLICEFIATRRQEYGVAPICRALGVLGVQIAPRTYRAHLARPPSKRALWDAAITEVLAGHYELDEQGWRPPECLYGATKMWAYLNREGIEVARCTVERLMRANGWRGATRRPRCAPRWPTPLRPGRRMWSTGSSMPQNPVCCTWPTSPNGRVGLPVRHGAGGWRGSLRFHRSGAVCGVSWLQVITAGDSRDTSEI
jgi:hypothetical protein